ncbi:hypothetical protein FSP39_013807 [Pinctada imbricata]|uniref:Uncharacterized protein n=1 Tax=Pinctada imbricata TaxID=66713 RepID=A0AA88Y020_PINIB|nr:hypothetical protein FSP39_013807 [Pinctada imbricata]
MKEAIKVKLKHDKHGMGHNAGEEFTFHWWDHVFNKAASSISVEQNEQGIKVKKVAENGPIKNKKTKTFCDKKLLYGQFVKVSHYRLLVKNIIFFKVDINNAVS